MEMKIHFPGGSRVDAEFESFSVSTDQPVRKGGQGAAPAPVDYFLASIGTCAGFYVLQFLKQRGLPTADASVTLSTVRDPDNRRIAEIVLEVHLPPECPPRYEQAIVRAIDLCAVKRHIEDPPVFRTEIVRRAEPAVRA